MRAVLKVALAVLLAPFSLIYALVVHLRGWAYDRGVFRPQEAGLPTVGVGNLSAGGSGKSPMVAWLVEELRRDFRLAVLSRGYGRETTGFVEVSAACSAREVGDEPLQLKLRQPDVVVAVCEDRVRGCEELRARYPGLELIILDDAYQHRRLRCGFEILLTPFARPFDRDWYLPSGRLRDARSQRHRARVVVLTKCPVCLTDGQVQRLRARLTVDGQDFACSWVEYEAPRGLWPQALAHDLGKGDEVALLTGIAAPAPFVRYVAQHWCIRSFRRMRDHAHFGPATVRWIEAQLRAGLRLLTTEKDAARLRELFPLGDPRADGIFLLPISLGWRNADGSIVKERVVEYVRSCQKVG